MVSIKVTLAYINSFKENALNLLFTGFYDSEIADLGVVWFTARIVKLDVGMRLWDMMPISSVLLQLRDNER